MSLFGFLKPAPTNKTVLISPDNVSIPAGRGISILQAAEDAGLAFPHSCRVGSCGTCRCSLVKGRIKRYTDFSYVLDRAAIQTGAILACQSEAIDDVVITLDKPLASYSRQRNLRGEIRAIERVNADVIILTIGVETRIDYSAGQIAELVSPGGVRRPYSFASAPALGGNDALTFHIRREAGGRFTGWLFEEAATGDPLGVIGPSGDFGYRSSERPILCVAGGTGFAPINAILTDQRTRDQAPRAHIIVAARSQDSFYAQTQAIADLWGDRLTQTFILSETSTGPWKGETGFAHEALHAFLSKTPGDYDLYVAGPPVMVDACKATADTLGAPPAQFRSDSFTSAAGLTGA